MSIALFVAAGLSFWPFQHRQTDTARYLIPAWHIDATLDRFTGRRICRVYQGSRRRPTASYQRGTLAFRFARGLDTTRADFRVDDGPAKAWTSVYPTLIGSGATLTGKSMTNPTGGLVILPVSEFENAATVTLRSAPRSRPRTFSVSGLRDALASAQRLGCNAEYGFAR